MCRRCGWVLQWTYTIGCDIIPVLADLRGRRRCGPWWHFRGHDA